MKSNKQWEGNRQDRQTIRSDRRYRIVICYRQAAPPPRNGNPEEKIPVYRCGTIDEIDPVAPFPFQRIKSTTGAVLRFFVIAIALPLVPVILFFPERLPATLTLLSAAFILEYGAATVGIGLGLPAPYVLFVLACFGVGISLFLFDLLEALGSLSARIAGFLEKSAELAKRSRLFSRYGVYGLVPCVIIISIYVCPPASWVFGWDRSRSLALILGGYLSAAIVTTLASAGILHLLFP